jgi:hypothetical protein
LKFKLQWRGQWYEFDLHSEKIGELSGKMAESEIIPKSENLPLTPPTSRV